MIRAIIAGGRDFDDIEHMDFGMWKSLGYMSLPDDAIILSGGARGADRLGESWAKEYGYPVKKYPADWEKHGKAAGMIRNAQMAENADILVAFWDGKSKGTQHMIKTAMGRGLEVHVYRY